MSFDHKMSANPAVVTPPRPSRRLVSPVVVHKERETTEVLCNGGPRRENNQGFDQASTPSTISMPRIDSSILGKETLEQREKFTVRNRMRDFDIAFSLRLFALYSVNFTHCLCIFLPSCTKLR